MQFFVVHLLTLCTTFDIIILWYGKRGDTMSPNKMGRPKVDNPINLTVTVRVDANTMKKLDDYCKNQGVSRGEAVRRGIDLLEKESNGNTSTDQS